MELAIVIFLAVLTGIGLADCFINILPLVDPGKEAESVNVDSTPSTGVVLDAIEPPAEGCVKYGGSFWKAVADAPIAAGVVVRIVEKKDLIIKVRALNAGKEE